MIDGVVFTWLECQTQNSRHARMVDEVPAPLCDDISVIGTYGPRRDHIGE